MAGKGEGMQFMDDAIWEHLVSGATSPHEAYMKAIDKQRFRPFLPAEEAELGNSAGLVDDGAPRQDKAKKVGALRH